MMQDDMETSHLISPMYFSLRLFLSLIHVSMHMHHDIQTHIAASKTSSLNHMSFLSHISFHLPKNDWRFARGLRIQNLRFFAQLAALTTTGRLKKAIILLFSCPPLCHCLQPTYIHHLSTIIIPLQHLLSRSDCMYALVLVSSQLMFFDAS